MCVSSYACVYALVCMRDLIFVISYCVVYANVYFVSFILYKIILIYGWVFLGIYMDFRIADILLKLKEFQNYICLHMRVITSNITSKRMQSISSLPVS